MIMRPSVVRLAFGCVEALRVASVLLGCAVPSWAAPAASADRPEDGFEGRLLVVASDGDMQASAYTGAPLGQPAQDLLSVVQLGQPFAGAVPATVEVPNSVVGPPASLAVTPDGRYAIVVETRGSHPSGRPEAMLRDLPPGKRVTVVDLTDPAMPRVIQQFDGADNPIAVSIRSDGKQVAIAYDTTGSKQSPLALYRFAEGRLSAPETPPIPGFGRGDALKNVAYDNPLGLLALVYAVRPRLSFMRWREDKSKTILEPWGNDVALPPTPFEVRFTPDGRYALVNDMTAPTAGLDVRGTVTSIAVASGETSDGAPQHKIVSQARTGVLPEGLAVSPDARWVATSNLERTAFSLDDPRQGSFASITLLKLDPQTGQLLRAAEAAFNGIIPEGIVFDDASRFLAVIAFDHFPGRPAGSAVDVWRLVGDFQDAGRVELVATGISIPVARGAQSMEIVR